MTNSSPRTSERPRLQPAPTRQADRLYHHLIEADEINQIRREVRALVDSQLTELAHQIAQSEESSDSFPREAFGILADAKVFGVPFSAEVCGRGLPEPVGCTAAALEEIAYVSNSLAAVVDVHCILAGHALAQGDARVQQRYLTRVVTGEIIGSFATTEPAASSDLSVDALSTTAELSGDEWIINGHKRFISNSPVADFVALLCKTGQQTVMIVVDLPAPGVAIGPPDRKLGNRGQLTADMVFQDVRVPVENTIGSVGDGLRIALQTLTYGRIGIAATGVGMAQASFDYAIEHLSTRHAFGKRLADFQYWQFRMAERATELEAARSLYVKAAHRLDRGVAFPEPEAAMAKAYATRLAVEMASDAIQVFGGYGFLRELGSERQVFRLEEIYRDAKIGEIYEGTNEIQKWIIARSIFGRDISG